jgi:transcriptional regulator GlxA family with amidase domain
MTRRRIGILLFDDVEELDAVGPWEVLSYWTRNFPEDGFDVMTIGRDTAVVTCAKGLRLLPDRSLSETPPLEVLIYQERLDWLRAQRDTVPLITSVCTGSLVLAKAGLLAGRPATTHWASLDLLAELDPTIEIRADDRFVDDGDIITSAGVSAGIDMALHLVARVAGVDRARQVRRGIQYDPEPPV